MAACTFSQGYWPSGIKDRTGIVHIPIYNEQEFINTGRCDANCLSLTLWMIGGYLSLDRRICHLISSNVSLVERKPVFKPGTWRAVILMDGDFQDFEADRRRCNGAEVCRQEPQAAPFHNECVWGDHDTAVSSA